MPEIKEQYYTIFVSIPANSASEAKRIIHLALAHANIKTLAIERGQGIET